MYQRILVPVDGSAASERGIHEAICLALAQDARVLFLHVLDEKPLLLEGMAQASLDEMLRGMRHAALDLLTKARQAAEKASVHCETLLREVSGGPIADMIVDQFDEMIDQCRDEPLCCPVSLHTFIVGHPFRLRPLRQAFKHCLEHPQKDLVWFTRPGEVADYCYGLPEGVLVAA